MFDQFNIFRGDKASARSGFVLRPFILSGHVTSNVGHREFTMTMDELSRGEFATFLGDAPGASLHCVVEGGRIVSCIDWRSVDVLIGCGRGLRLRLLNLVVWRSGQPVTLAA